VKPDNSIKRAVYAGSFDPLTRGHIWMIEQAAGIFHELVVAVGVNADKKAAFTLEERLEMLRRSTRRFANVRIASFANMFLVRFAESVKADCVVRGIRNSSDYEFERSMRQTNEDLGPGVLTVFMMPPRGISELSSSLVKGLIGPEGWEDAIAAYVPGAVYDRLLEQNQGLLPRLESLWKRLGARSDPRDVYRSLQERHIVPERYFHTLGHVAGCLRELDGLRLQAGDADAIEAALWFHDVVYVPGNPDNENLSAEYAGKILAEAGLEEERIARIRELILATRHRQTPVTPDGRLIADIDLSIFGRPPCEYLEYEQAVRDEYSALTELDFSRGRYRFLQSILARALIYYTPDFQTRYEAQARRNLELSLPRWAE
jgi:pantetheine-phosphate adenylyltransferase